MDSVQDAALRAMVLSAGYGTRLGDVTRRTPKPMLRLAGRPLLEHIVGNLAVHGFRDIVISLHFMPEMITDYFGDGSSRDVRLTYSFEEELLGTAGGVKKMESFFQADDAFLVHYGDVVTDQDFSSMLDFHRRKKALATLLVHRRTRSNSVVELEENGRIVLFLERPVERLRPAAATTWVNSGVAICDPEILRHIPAATFSDLPRDVFPALVRTGRLYGFPLSGYRCAVDSPARLQELEEAVRAGRYRIAEPAD